MANGTATANAATPLSPQHVYTSLDDATHAACCLSGLHKAGASIHVRITDSLTEEYMVTLHPSVYQATSGALWQLVGRGWEPCYTITRDSK